MIMRISSLLIALMLLLLSGCSSMPRDTEVPVTETVTEVAPEQVVYPSLAVAAFNQANKIRADKPEQAMVGYREAIEIAPTMEPAVYNLGRLLFDQQQYQEVLKLASASADKTVQSARLWNLVATTQRMVGQFNQAKTSYERALTIDPTHLGSHRNLGILLDIYLHEPEQAVAQYQTYQQQLEQAGKTDPDLANWLADIRQRMGN